MKWISTSLLGVSLLAITTLSCSKDEPAEARQQTRTAQVINANVPAGETYVLNMSAGTTASIVTQAQHYQLSEIATTSNGGLVYKYIGGKEFSGTDEVTLQQTITSTGQGSGCSRNNGNGYNTTSIKTIVIKLSVAK